MTASLLNPSRRRLLDLYCGAGGAGTGYARAGFDVVGVDIARQPRYPFAFVQADALEFLAAHGHEFDAIHASPPCQAHSSMRAWVEAVYGARDYPDLIPDTRRALIAVGRPYVIENVVGSSLIDPVQLCGSSFGRPLRRHRRFESSVPLLVPPCVHRQLPAVHHAITRRGGRSRYIGVYGSSRHAGDLTRRRAAMGIDWMSGHELTQAIPPDYTELIGLQLLAALTRRVLV